MRAVLPGRPESTHQALSTANWDGLRLVAYVSGKAIIIFNGRREILQTITIDEVQSLQGISIEERSGRLAVHGQDHVYVYEALGRDYGDIRWTLLQEIHSPEATKVNCLSWASPDELLIGGSELRLWSFADNSHAAIIWSSALASPVSLSVFSDDGGIIATCGHHDRLVKIWRRLSYEVDGTRFDVSYLSHSAGVTNLQWRKPWHAEQNLEDLLYTFCSDNRVRVWAYSDPHAISVMQEIANIDMNASIQPRRLSVGSVSKKRFTFILDSRDISRATEKAVQLSRQGTDHALEHLIEIANRSPEICVVLDGLGHMSAWGLENAGYRNKLPTERFNVALVDGVDINLPISEKDINEYIHIYGFANHDAVASLCVLVHSYSGKIDWYQGSIVGFFDTSRRDSRIQLLSSWSGHASAIECITSSPSGTQFVSWTAQHDVIVWLLTNEAAFVREHEFDAEAAIVDVLLLENSRFAIVLHPNALSLWKLDGSHCHRVSRVEVDVDDHVEPKALSRLDRSSSGTGVDVAILFTDGQCEHWQAHTGTQDTIKGANGANKPLVYVSSMADKTFTNFNNVLVPQCTLQNEVLKGDISLIALSSDGLISAFTSRHRDDGHLEFRERLSTFSTLRNISDASATSDGRCVLYDPAITTVHIWNIQQDCFELYRTFAEAVEGTKWLRTEEDNLLLAIYFTYKIVVMAQRKLTANKNELPWSEQAVIRMRDHTNLPIKDLCWTRTGDLVIAAGNQIFLIEIDLKPLTATNVEGSEINFDRSLPSDLALQNSEMSLFDPDLLQNIALDGCHTLLTRILIALNQELRFLVKEEYLNSYLELDLHEVIKIPTSSDSDIEHATNRSEAVESILENADKFPDSQLNDYGKSRLRSVLTAQSKVSMQAASLDHFAQKYFYLLRTTPMGFDLPWSACVFAALSTTQEALLDLTLRFAESQYDDATNNFKLTWSNARRLGLFLWIQDLTSLRNLFEQVARAEYNKDSDNRNPVDCSLFYLALNKKSVLLSLWRTTLGIREKENTMKLLGRDFSEQRWKETALKNAYALLSKRRFEYAAAWFLLGGSLRDAVNVCTNQIGDVQLAIAIARVWEGDAQIREQTITDLSSRMLGTFALESTDAKWIAIWTCVANKNWKQVIRYIVLPVDRALDKELRVWSKQHEDTHVPPKSLSYETNEPTLLLDIFRYIRDELIKLDAWTEDVASERDEWDFIMRCVRHYTKSGMSILAARLVRHWQFVPRQVTAKVQGSKSTISDDTIDAGLQQQSSASQLPTAAESQKKPPATQFIEPSADSLLDSFGF